MDVFSIVMRETTLPDLERQAANEEGASLPMDEETFRAFYDRTARPVWAYLSKITGDSQLADDLLQEAYYRFLRARVTHDSDAHRRNYLFRIATNLVRDLRRRPHVEDARIGDSAMTDHPDPQSADVAAAAARRVDLGRAMTHLKPRERDLLWLAYAQGSSHKEIAETLGLKTASVKLLLFRARQRLARFLREGVR